VKVKRRGHPVQHAAHGLRVAEHELLKRVGNSVINRQRDIRSIKRGTPRSVCYIDAKQPIPIAQLQEDKI
jgi:hypothetical protein